MKLCAALSFTTFLAAYCLASGVDPLAMDHAHPRDLVVRDPHDRGTFIMFCAGQTNDPDYDTAYGACNNACYSINCINSHNPNASVMHIAQDLSIIRPWSGCNVGSMDEHTIIEYSPFNQLFIDLVGLAKNQVGCDQWPMAETEQVQPGPGRPPTSLRIIPDGESIAARIQLGSFTGNDKWSGIQTKKNGKGKVQYPDYFSIEFNTGNMSDADKQKYTPYCQAKANTPSCDNDGKQFFMSSYQDSSLSTPYNWDRDNRYQLGPTGNVPKGDIRQCSIDLQRDSGSAYWEASLYNIPWEATGPSSKRIDFQKGNMAKGQQMLVKGGPQWITVTNVDDAPADGDGVTKTKLRFETNASGLQQGLSWDTDRWCTPFKLVKGQPGQEGWHCDFPCI